jgi:D-beta-D-heptose 7-phosphate kinase/D-beta-D-heptose 1-phosphate adenosyltransferase
LFDKLKDKKICVVGDVMVDHYRLLSAKRVSPESPTIIFHPYSEEIKAGGAGNVATNLKVLGVRVVPLISVLGESEFLTFPEPFFKVREPGRKTTIKERLITKRQQILRIDTQSDVPITMDSANKLLETCMGEIASADAIVFSDYAHGVMIPELVGPILERAIEKGVPTVVDSKARDTLTKYRGATIVLPNLDEAKMFTRLDDFDADAIARFILKNMHLKAAAITIGPKGIMLAEPGMEIRIFPPLNEDVEHEVVDVTGAGDTVAAVVACGLCVGMPYDRIMKLANVAAGVKVQKRGVAAITPAEIMATIEQHKLAI